ncbi:hypothetical protein CU663_10330, partial [Pseudomonas syringae pv. actinidifoliorum]|nr:hypothetical protein [Pseudomonas syringae pv. actinidifoliorum]
MRRLPAHAQKAAQQGRRQRPGAGGQPAGACWQPLLPSATRWARAWISRIEEYTDCLDANPPIYLMLTKTDQLPGLQPGIRRSGPARRAATAGHDLRPDRDPPPKACVRYSNQAGKSDRRMWVSCR